MKTLFCTILLALLTASAAFAGDYAELTFIGFSPDGKYMAFEESGEWDGAGGEYATTYFVDVAKNKYAMPPAVFKWQEDSKKSERALLAKYNTAVAVAIKKLKIVRGNTGSQLVAHLLNDWTHVKPIETDSYWIRDGEQTQKKMPNYSGAFLDRGDLTEKVIFNPWLYVNNLNTDSFYELTLLKTPFRGKPCEQSDDALKIEMTLKDNTQHKDTALQILQKDTSVPEARNCAYGYRIEQVYYHSENIVVFLNVFSQGFEGPDMRYMAVTGSLNYKSNPPGE